MTFLGTTTIVRLINHAAQSAVRIQGYARIRIVFRSRIIILHFPRWIFRHILTKDDDLRPVQLWDDMLHRVCPGIGRFGF